MQTLPQTICDRCGVSPTYIHVNAKNGYACFDYDLCKPCSLDLRAMMLNFERRDWASAKNGD